MNTKANKLSSIKLTRSNICLLSFFIPFIIILISMIIGGFAPFGSKDILTASGNQSLYSFYHEFHDRLRDGSLFSYSTQTGLGYDFTTAITYYMSDPINMLVLLFHNSAMPALFNLLYILKIGLAGLFFSIFLLNKTRIISNSSKGIYYNTSGLSEGKLYIIAFATAYALSSHMLCYGMNISYTTTMALFPLVIMGIDRIIFDKKCSTYIIAFSLSIYTNFYISIIVFIFSIFYIIIQEYDDFRLFSATVIRKSLSDILVFAISSLIIVNNFSSQFMKNDLSIQFYSKGFFSNIWNVFKMMLVTSPSNNLESSSYGINIYVGLICLFMIIPFLLNKNIKLSFRIKNIILLTFLIIACAAATTNYLFNGFHLTSNNSVFFGFIICFMLLNICHSAVINLSYTKSPVIIAGFTSSVSIVIASMVFCEKYDSSSPFITSLEFLFFLLLVFLIRTQPKIQGKVFTIILSAIMLIEISINCFSVIISLGNDSVSYSETKDYNTEVAINYIRAEYPSSRVFVYDPTISTETPFTFTINGYDYILTDSEQEQFDYLEYIGNVGTINVYRNPYSLSSGVNVDTDPSVNPYIYLNPYTSSNFFITDVLHMPSIFKSVIGRAAANDNSDQSGSLIMDYIIETSGTFYSNIGRLTFHVNNIEENIPFSFYFPESKLLRRDKVLGGEFTTLDVNLLKSVYEKYKTTSSIANGNSIKTIFSDNNGYTIYPLTESSKWFTDNNSVNTVNPAGNELLYINGVNKLTFSPKYFIIGLIVSLLSIVLGVAILILSARQSVSDNIVINKIAGFAARFEVPIILFNSSTAMFILIFMYTCCQPFGTNSAFLSDGYVQYYPTITNAIYKALHGELEALNYQMGFGIDNYVMLSGWLLNPYTWSIGLFKNIYSVIAYTMMHYLSFITISFTVYLYLSHRPSSKINKPTRLTIITCSLAYTFSSYTLSYFSFFLGIVFLVPLIMLTTEHLLYNKKVLPYLLVMTFTMVTCNYTAFLICEYLVLFFFITDFENVRDFFTKGIRFAWTSILSAGLSAVILIPFYYFTKLSPYKNNDSFPTPNLKNSLLKSVYDLQIFHLPEPVTTDDTRSNMYCGIAVLLLIAIYIINNKIKLSVRIRTILLIFFLYFALGNPFLNFVLHGFHVQVMVPNRFSIFMVLLLITCFLETITHLGELSKKKVIISVSVWSLFLLSIFTFRNKESFDLSFYTTTILLLLYLGLIMLYIHKKNEVFKRALLFILISEVLINAYLVSHMSIGSQISTDEAVITQTAAIAEKHHLGDSKLTRTELINYLMINGSCFTDTNSITYFSSTTTHYNTDMSNAFNILTGTNAIEYSQGNPLSNLMLSVKYFFSSDFNNYMSVPSYYKTIDQQGSIKLYENELSLDPGILLPNDFKLERTDFDNAIDYQNKISQQIISKDIYTNITPEIIWESDPIASSDLQNNEDDKVYIVVEDEMSADDVYSTSIIVPDSLKGYVYISYLNTLYYLGDNIEHSADFSMNFSSEFLDDTYKESIRIGIVNLDNVEELKDKLNENIMTNISYEYNTITGDIDASHSGIVFLSVAAYPTWDVYVDNVKVETTQILGGLGIPVSSGKHSIKLIYHTSGIKEGAIISLISLLILITIIISSRIFECHKKFSEELPDISNDTSAIF